MARLALANISDPERMERYNATALAYLEKADQARTGAMPPPSLSSRRTGTDRN
jgi:hypothetical protein